MRIVPPRSKAARSGRDLHRMMPFRPRDAETGWLRRSAFLSELQAQIRQARTERSETTLICCDIPVSHWARDSRPRLHMSVRLGLLVGEAAMEGASFGRLSEDEFAVCVPHTEDPWRAAMAALIEDRLASFAGPSGVAAFSIAPGEQLESAAILDAARATLDRRSMGNLVYLDDYRHRRRPHAA